MKNPRSKARTNNKLNPNEMEYGNRTQVTEVGGECLSSTPPVLPRVQVDWNGGRGVLQGKPEGRCGDDDDKLYRALFM